MRKKKDNNNNIIVQGVHILYTAMPFINCPPYSREAVCYHGIPFLDALVKNS